MGVSRAQRGRRHPGRRRWWALSFQARGVRTQVVRRLRRGLIPIEDELDLHALEPNAGNDYQLPRKFLTNRAAMPAGVA